MYTQAVCFLEGVCFNFENLKVYTGQSSKSKSARSPNDRLPIDHYTKSLFVIFILTYSSYSSQEFQDFLISAFPGSFRKQVIPLRRSRSTCADLVLVNSLAYVWLLGHSVAFQAS